MRIYLSAGLAEVEVLAAGTEISAQRFVPSSEDEAEEFESFSEAAALGGVVVSADVGDPDAPVTLAEVASFHLDVDGSGDLAWYATQEVDAVLLIMRNTASEA